MESIPSVHFVKLSLVQVQKINQLLESIYEVSSTARWLSRNHCGFDFLIYFQLETTLRQLTKDLPLSNWQTTSECLNTVHYEYEILLNSLTISKLSEVTAMAELLSFHKKQLRLIMNELHIEITS
jgi:hypothetical protein